MRFPVNSRNGNTEPDPIDYGNSTHIGGRPFNQDGVRVTPASIQQGGRGRLFAVADGMGGQPGGGVASHMACEGLGDYYERPMHFRNSPHAEGIRIHLTETILRVDRSIRLQGLKDRKLEEMGTTLSCLVITELHSIIAHVGDSRIYRLRKDRLSCLTVDHTFVQELIDDGEVDPVKAHLHPLRHMLTRAMGTGEALPLVDTRIDPLKTGDRFLLCTDGLYNVVSATTIADLLSMDRTAVQIASEMVETAYSQGAGDNITAVVVKWCPPSGCDRY